MKLQLTVAVRDSGFLSVPNENRNAETIDVGKKDMRSVSAKAIGSNIMTNSCDFNAGMSS